MGRFANRQRAVGWTFRSGVVGMTVAAALAATSLSAQSTAAQVQQQPGPPIVDAAVRARFSVVVTADQTVTARIYEYLQLLAKRNTIQSRFGGPATAAELELVLLFNRRPRMPWNRRDIGTVNLKINPADDTAAVEYCMRRCGDTNADLVEYRQSLVEFLRKLDEASAGLGRYR